MLHPINQTNERALFFHAADKKNFLHLGIDKPPIFAYNNAVASLMHTVSITR